MQQYCIYLRKSRADMEAESQGEMETLARHEKILLDLAKRMKLSITKIYKEIVSGETISARPVVQRLLQEVEQDIWTGVLVMEVERLARGDTIDQGIVARAFKMGNAKIITPIKVYDPNNEFDEEYFEFGLFMSRREYKTINRRLQQGRLQSIKEGKYIGSVPPYGYIKKKLDKVKGYTLEPHPEQAEVVKMMFDLYVNGELLPDGTRKQLGASLITRKLNELKITPLKGGKWVVASVRDILSNPIYAGKIRWNRRSVEKKIVGGEVIKIRPKRKAEDCLLFNGLHEPIIDPDLYNASQLLSLNSSHSPVPGNRTIKNPLSGIVVCGKCGRKMVRRPYRPYRDTDDVLMCSAVYCDNISSSLKSVEESVLKALAGWSGNFKAKVDDPVKLESHIQVKERALSIIEKDLTQLNYQLNNTYDLLEQRIYSIDTFMKRNMYLARKIDECNEEHENALNELMHEKQIESQRNSIIPKIEKVLKIYRTVDSPAEKNILLKEVIQKVVYIKNVNGRWNNSPDDFELDLYPHLPSSDE